MHGTVIKKQFWIHIYKRFFHILWFPQEEIKDTSHKQNAMASEEMCFTWFVITNIIQVAAADESLK